MDPKPGWERASEGGVARSRVTSRRLVLSALGEVGHPVCELGSRHAAAPPGLLLARSEREARTGLEAALGGVIRGDVVRRGIVSPEAVLAVLPGPGEPVAEFLASMRPGPALGAVLQQAATRELSADDRLEVVRGWERMASWLAAQQARALAAARDAIASELAPAPESAAAEHWSGQDAAEAEIGAALRWSLPTVTTRLRQAAALTGRCAPTLVELERGRIEPRQASAVVDAVAQLQDADAVAQVQERLLPRAPEQTVAQTRRSLRRAVLAVDPASAAERHERARAGRGVQRYAEPDGMAALEVRTDAAGVATIFAALDAVAATLPKNDPETGEHVPLSARRVDGLVALCGALLGDPTVLPGLARAAVPVPAVRVTAPLDTLLGLSERPGELAGYGPIPAPVVRELASDGAWKRWLVEPQTGELLDVGATTYRPSARLAAFVTARDRTCRGPGSGQPADQSDLDHIEPYDGANTKRDNLQPLRRRWHNAKTHGGWEATRAPDGTTHWRTPLGRRYSVPPESLDPG
ncbi:DUF222 domain-containing protein [Motilibacter deserti]|uniref:DUF222 domain-containing protein n=1 Tax=Motilibacter deserti TaxID=2714956 RepID=A0ABX0GQR4_9ACTN|nr:DUF222 domain-containing protein [Motilibacter deserti]NHC13057.1 DUF222 domain-containing protein [Motilibacter deserti]